MSSGAPLTFRPATGEDAPLLFELFTRARKGAFTALGLPAAQLEALLRMQHQAQKQGHRAGWPHAEERILLQGGAPVGFMRVDTSGPEWVLVDFAVLEPGKGLGTLALAALCAEADQAARPIALQVARDNPALHLYMRAGFVEASNDAVYLQLRRAPSTPTAL